MAARAINNTKSTCDSCGEQCRVKEQYDGEMRCEGCFENEYSNYAYEKRDGRDVYLVAGGGMMNGNAYAEVIVDKKNKSVIYQEYGQNAFSNKYPHSKLKWDSDGYSFDVVDWKKKLTPPQRMSCRI